MAGPLTDIRGSDLATAISGPLATMILGDQGTDIIKIQQPDSQGFSRHVATYSTEVSASFPNHIETSVP
jgi:crotonobetainyl-CoA:carnitine CoA-transferase CaiB-like acyl-CoA transferase